MKKHITINQKDLCGAMIAHSELLADYEFIGGVTIPSKRSMRIHLQAQDGKIFVLEADDITFRPATFEEEGYHSYDRSKMKETKWEITG